MLVYQYLNEENGIRALTECRLKISRINDLNDPFELLSPNLSNRKIRSAFSKMKNRLNDEYGLLCFSTTWRNPVMWSHYADRHRGFCLGLQVPAELLMRVKYLKQRPSPRHFLIDEDLDKQVEELKKVLCTKFRHWQYESEVRWIVQLAGKDRYNGLYFEKFSDELILKRVIVGSKATISRNDVRGALRPSHRNIETFKARAAFKTFEVVENKNSSLWT